MKLENKIKKVLATSLLVGALASNVFAQDKDYFVDLGIKGVYENQLINKIENIPVKVRDVEYYRNFNVMPVAKNNVKFNGDYSIVDTRIGREVNFNKNIKAKFGIGLEFILDSESSKNEDDYKLVRKPACEISEDWDREGVYYDFHPTYFFNENKYVRPNIFSEIEFEIKENNKEDEEWRQITLALGYKLSKEEIISENGYKWKEYWSDREEYRKKKRHNIINLITGRPYISLKYNIKEGYGFLDFGFPRIIKKDFSKLGKQMDFDFNDKDWYVGVGFRIFGNF